MQNRKVDFIFWQVTGVFLAACAVVFLLSQFLSPRFEFATFTSGDVQSKSFEMPLWIPKEGPTITVNADMLLPPLYPRYYRLIPDDCLQELWINAEKVEGVNFCDSKGIVFNLGAHLHAGKNVIRAVIRDDGGWGKFTMPVAAMDPIAIGVQVLFAFLVAGYMSFVLWRTRAHPQTWLLCFICFGAILAGKLYEQQFLFYEFAYDWDGHMEYVQYVRAHWNIPPAKDGWQFYQAPMYYFLTAMALWVGENVLGRSEYLLMQDIESLSWVFMSIAICVVAYISCLLFPKANNRSLRSLFTLLVLALPGLVPFSNRVSNDVLLFLCFVGFTAFLLRWWKNTRTIDWYMCTMLLSFALLTKSNAIPLLAVGLACLLFQRKVRFVEKWRLGLVFFFTAAAVTGWLFLFRFAIQGETFVVGNTLTHHLGVTNALQHWIVFNPLKLISIPFNNNWSDDFRRGFFWEYLFRSLFFGEFNFGERYRALASMIVTLGLAAMLIGVVGVWNSIRTGLRDALPMIFLAFALLGTLAAYRFVSPYSPNQDFRFISLVILPFAYFVTRGADALPRSLQKLGFAILSALLVSWIFFTALVMVRF
jgi:hypothetical protein